VRSAVSPHTPDTEAWQTAAVKKAIYTPPGGTDTQLLHLSAFHKKGEVCRSGGGARRVSVLWGLCWRWCWFIFLELKTTAAAACGGLLSVYASHAVRRRLWHLISRRSAVPGATAATARGRAPRPHQTNLSKVKMWYLNCVFLCIFTFDKFV
jgi:hypothetical protein